MFVHLHFTYKTPYKYTGILSQDRTYAFVKENAVILTKINA